MSITIGGFTNQKVTFTRKSGGAYGTSAEVTLHEMLPCRFVESGVARWNPQLNAESIVGNAQLWVDDPIVGVRVGDKALIEENTEFTIMTVSRLRDIEGNFDHAKIILV